MWNVYNEDPSIVLLSLAKSSFTGEENTQEKEEPTKISSGIQAPQNFRVCTVARAVIKLIVSSKSTYSKIFTGPSKVSMLIHFAYYRY